MKRLLYPILIFGLTLFAGCASLGQRQPIDDLGPMPAVTEDGGTLPLEETDETAPKMSGAISDADLWERVREGFALDLDLDNPRIKAQRDWYANHQAYLDRVATRAERYMHYIVEQTGERNIPMEMALLPIVESAFDPFAYSHGRAAGAWQFIPSTGRHFGLEQNWWYDGRRDVTASTDAALKYLSQLAARFDGDWLLALASYNAGGGTVSKAIRYNEQRGLPTDFWNLRLPRETSAYVPKLIAISQLIRDPEKYGVTIKPIKDAAYFVSIDIGGQIDLAEAAELADISVEELYLLNPGYSRWATPPEGPHTLLIPVDNAESFNQRLADLPEEARMRWDRYTIRSGDSLISIANRFKTTPDTLRTANKVRGNTIIAGNTLLIPRPSASRDSYSLSADKRLEAVQNKQVSGKQKHDYTVRNGDSFWKISRKFNVGVRELAKWNNMAPGDPLKVGQSLAVWSNQPLSASGNDSPVRPEMIRKVNYAVRNGDSLSRIANRFNVSINQIADWNRLNTKKYLRPGQKLTLYVDVRNAF
ncbi:MAG: LysM peptidoglycan-binding domain-containing protein [Alcanivoracaceae bacterium]|nr:LysM peptidoglycan-binding domain-containing protein [Alcanivoracaceae bacterium]